MLSLIHIFTGADIRNGMTAVISIKHPDPRFEGQTKTKLDNQDAARATGKIVNEEVVRYFDKNLDTLKVVLSCAEKAAKIRKTEEKARTNPVSYTHLPRFSPSQTAAARWSSPYNRCL